MGLPHTPCSSRGGKKKGERESHSAYMLYTFKTKREGEKKRKGGREGGKIITPGKAA